MKKRIVLLVFTLGVYLTSFGQKNNEQPYLNLDIRFNFKSLNSLGLFDSSFEVSDEESQYKFGAGASVNYFFLYLTDEITFGPTAGVDWYKGNAPIEDEFFVPVGASIKVGQGVNFTIGAEAGYSIGLTNAEGGFYYRGYIGLTYMQLSYSSIQLATGNLSVFQAGFNIPLNKL